MGDGFGVCRLILEKALRYLNEHIYKLNYVEILVTL